MASPRYSFPFAAVVGMPLAKRALMLLAVEPRLKGLVLTGGAGTAKSVLARGFLDLRSGDIPFIDLPLNISDESLLGGIDLEKTLKLGKPFTEPGLLSKADKGVLYIDEINLHESRILHLILAALDAGVCRVERDGVSAVMNTNFVLIGSCDPSDGEIDASVLNRVGLIVSDSEPLSLEHRTELIERQRRFTANPEKFAKEFAKETALLKRNITHAKSILDRVEIKDEDVRRLSLAAIRFGIEGNRSDVFATMAARANAALSGRDIVSDEDLSLAVQLVLVPRANTIPAERQSETQPSANNQNDYSSDQASDQTQTNSQPALNDKQSISQEEIEELVIEALNSEFPNDLLPLPELSSFENRFSRFQSGRSNRSRQHSKVLTPERGKHVTSVAKSDHRSRLDIMATLRAAAPYQRLRRSKADSHSKVVIKREDLRFKQFKQKIGSLYIFIVDTSGSMALNRINQAKGAIGQILEQSYLRRDKVALISFRKDKAEVLLQPSQSVALTKRSVDALPVGGGTPLSAGLLAGLQIAERARRQSRLQPSLVLFTDGRANVGMDAQSRNDRQLIQQELNRIGEQIRMQKIPSFVIDTQLKFTSSGEGERLANMLGGRYVYLPRADSQGIVRTISPNTVDANNAKV